MSERFKPYAGMTMNERLMASGKMDVFTHAVRAGDQAAVVQLYRELVTDDHAEAVSSAAGVFAMPWHNAYTRDAFRAALIAQDRQALAAILERTGHTDLLDVILKYPAAYLQE